jgi:hypothetical protein
MRVLISTLPAVLVTAIFAAAGCDSGGTGDFQQGVGSASACMAGQADSHACDPANTKKTTICHIPPGNPANQHTLCVGNAAVSAHLAHGDHTGACDTECGGKDGGAGGTTGGDTGGTTGGDTGGTTGGDTGGTTGGVPLPPVDGEPLPPVS